MGRLDAEIAAQGFADRQRHVDRCCEGLRTAASAASESGSVPVVMLILVIQKNGDRAIGQVKRMLPFRYVGIAVAVALDRIGAAMEWIPSHKPRPALRISPWIMGLSSAPYVIATNGHYRSRSANHSRDRPSRVCLGRTN